MNKHCVVGYHGTTQDSAHHILSGEPFRESRREDDWLGRGIYFYGYLEHAQWWTTHNRFKGKETTVLKADLAYTDEEMLDLDDPARRRELEKFVKQFMQTTANTVKPSQEISKEKSLCAACNLYRRFHKRIGITKYTFPQRRRYERSGTCDNQCQICVSNPSIIKKIEEV